MNKCIALIALSLSSCAQFHSKAKYQVICNTPAGVLMVEAIEPPALRSSGVWDLRPSKFDTLYIGVNNCLIMKHETPDE